ncbi:hypothetical protein P168DRAFT_333608 [Aspergillus campestris IBT 28561]|uniref:Uncharacterized protein n=1 Tax=Aspergillus campestris (strain IBT 28561) TaxID=1392248 RepID=A0A2I1CX79_ASPC2|nr:uncharacterized protein P168DRAFT_333608 [Aspergillus campestris IBT 28561]PKY02235.1 hypothetical protein P168DRAFT_333608 [Aspergillus campestris IBT 28561]
MFSNHNRQQKAYIKYEQLNRNPSVKLDSPSFMTDSPSDSNSNNNGNNQDEKTPQANHRFPLIKQTLALLLALFGLLDLAYRAYELTTTPQHPHPHPTSPISCNCGETIAEVLTNNCRYDSFAAAWLPPACRNDDLIEQFERAGPNPDGSWNYYADANKTRTLTLDEVARLPDTKGSFYTTHRWHLVHCAYYWKKMFLAAERGTVIEKRYNRMGHLEHCEMMFLARDLLESIVTAAGVALHSDVLVVKGGGTDTNHDHGHDHGDHENMGTYECCVSLRSRMDAPVSID